MTSCSITHVSLTLVLYSIGNNNGMFCTPTRAELNYKSIELGRYKIISIRDIGFKVGLGAIAMQRKASGARRL